MGWTVFEHSYCVVSDENGMYQERNASFTGQARRENCLKIKKSCSVSSKRCGW